MRAKLVIGAIFLCVQLDAITYSVTNKSRETVAVKLFLVDPAKKSTTLTDSFKLEPAVTKSISKNYHLEKIIVKRESDSAKQTEKKIVAQQACKDIAFTILPSIDGSYRIKGTMTFKKRV